MLARLLALGLAAAPALAPVDVAAPRTARPVLTLDAAVKSALAHQPALRQAHAGTLASLARADEARAPLLPQVSASAGYERSTSNFVERPGSLPRNLSSDESGSSFATSNFFSAGINASQLVYDFGQTPGRWSVARANATSQAESEKVTRLAAIADVRISYFAARAGESLVEVAQASLTNAEAHLQQIQGFVEVGTRPEIDLAQGRTTRANARVQLINARNAYETAKARLNQVMGVEGPTAYDVADETLPAVPEEVSTTDALLDTALHARPEVAALDAQLAAGKAQLGAIKGAYFPSLGVATSLNDTGPSLGNTAWNWSAQATLSWSIFSGLLTTSQVREASANLDGLQAQLDALRLQIRLEVDQARLAVGAAKESAAAAGEAAESAGEQLRLAEGRYQTGVGSVLELSDAQVADTNARAQQVQAGYALASARAQFMRALGRE